MAKNRLADLNDHLFEQMERLNDESLTPEQLDREIARTRGMCDLAGNVIDLGRLDLDAWKLRAEHQAPPDGPLLLDGKRVGRKGRP